MAVADLVGAGPVGWWASNKAAPGMPVGAGVADVRIGSLERAMGGRAGRAAQRARLAGAFWSCLIIIKRTHSHHCE